MATFGKSGESGPPGAVLGPMRFAVVGSTHRRGALLDPRGHGQDKGARPGQRP
jgi:hypothetical protein